MAVLSVVTLHIVARAIFEEGVRRIPAKHHIRILYGSVDDLPDLIFLVLTQVKTTLPFSFNIL